VPIIRNVSRNASPSGLSGMDLKLRRVAADVLAKDVAAAMGITTGRLSRIEDQPSLTDTMYRRYMEALDKCRTSRTALGAA